MSIAERYMRAIRSSHLEVEDAPGDIDSILAAGMARETLGVMLYRLRAESDLHREFGQASVVASAVQSHAITAAKRLRLDRLEAEIRTVADQVLDVFLSPGCPTCSGRGFNGGYGAPQVLCPPCRATGKRVVEYGQDVIEHEFARWLLDDLTTKIQEAERQIRAKQRDGLS